MGVALFRNLAKLRDPTRVEMVGTLGPFSCKIGTYLSPKFVLPLLVGRSGGGRRDSWDFDTGRASVLFFCAIFWGGETKKWRLINYRCWHFIVAAGVGGISVGLHQLRLLLSQISWDCSTIPGGCLGFLNHQQ